MRALLDRETCGLGACEEQARKACIDAVLVSQCEPGLPSNSDAACDGVDSDCDDRIDEDFKQSLSPAVWGRVRMRGPYYARMVP